MTQSFVGRGIESGGSEICFFKSDYANKTHCELKIIISIKSFHALIFIVSIIIVSYIDRVQ